ncbi:MAG TPA: DUF58 domain-containing protein [Trebonia sp.]|nr:DUF58 domain-containing protein [Trebonia sp.]
MRTLLLTLTTRGRSFVAAGVTALLCGLLIPESDLVRIGALLVALPLLSGLGASRTRYRLSCSRRAVPTRVPVGQPAEMTIRLTNVTRLRTGLLLAEDTVPYALGSRPRFVLDGIGRGGSHDFKYQVRSDARGKYVIGPLRVRVADSFGLVEINRAFASTSTLTVIPKVVPLSRAPLAGNWLGGDDGRRSIAASGDDDVAPRSYQTGDALRRVHWRSTARYGELMVRREEQHWRNTATLFLDTRRVAHGTAASFELAVSAAASIGVHLAEEGFDARLVTEAGLIPRQGTFHDTLLDTLAVIRPAELSGLHGGLSALRAAGGQIIAVLGSMTQEEAAELAATRSGGTQAMALVLGSSPVAVQVLSGAGWRAVPLATGMSLAAAWQQMHSTRGMVTSP